MSDAGEPVALCALDDLEDPGARAIDLAHGSVIVVRTGTRVAGYVNACPHKGTPLENPLGRVLDADGRHLVCSTHGARFRLEDGACVAGPCLGRSLAAVSLDIRGPDLVLRPADPTKV